MQKCSSTSLTQNSKKSQNVVRKVYHGDPQYEKMPKNVSHRPTIAKNAKKWVEKSTVPTHNTKKSFKIGRFDQQSKILQNFDKNC